MAEENNVNSQAVPQEQTQTQNQKTKPKSVKVKLILTGAGSCTIENVTLKKGDSIELEAEQAERFFKSELFVRA